MKKSKIAICLDKPLLELVDSKVDGHVIRSRSQAIEYFLRKGLQEQSITDAVMLIRGSQQNILLKEFKGKSFVKNQIEFFIKGGIKNIYILTQHTKEINFLLNETENSKINIEIIEKDASGNAEILKSIKNKFNNSFIVISGDTYNEFDLLKMIKKHLDADRLATIGLMTRENPIKYGVCILDGDLVIDFQEKPKNPNSNIVNAGVYIFKPEIFELFDEKTISIERDLLPKLAKIKQLVGYFTMGKYVHLE